MRIDWMTVFPCTVLCEDVMLMVVGGRIYGPGVNVQDTSTPERIATQAYGFLERNLLTGRHKEYGMQYSFSMPSSYKYGPSQWLWGIV